MTNSSALRLAAIALIVSAAFHLIAPIFGGIVSQTLQLFFVGIVYLLGALGLLRGWRWLGYVMFLILIVGMAVSLYTSFAPAPLPRWLYLGIFGADLVAWLGLFVYLWKNNPDR